eukprot:6173550-Pleurochrysis_carterae.AAC.2
MVSSVLIAPGVHGRESTSRTCMLCSRVPAGRRRQRGSPHARKLPVFPDRHSGKRAGSACDECRIGSLGADYRRFAGLCKSLVHNQSLTTLMLNGAC